MKIYQSAFVKDLVIDEGLSNCNANVISMKAGSSIEMIDLGDYQETNFHTYQRLVEKLIHLSCGTRSDIVFVVEQLSRHEADPRKNYF